METINPWNRLIPGVFTFLGRLTGGDANYHIQVLMNNLGILKFKPGKQGRYPGFFLAFMMLGREA